MAVLQLQDVVLGVRIGLAVVVEEFAVVPLDAVGVVRIAVVVGSMVWEPACLLSAFSLVRESLMQVFGSLLVSAKRTLGVSLAEFSSFEVDALVPLVEFPWLGESCPRRRKRLALSFAWLLEPHLSPPRSL